MWLSLQIVLLLLLSILDRSVDIGPLTMNNQQMSITTYVGHQQIVATVASNDVHNIRVILVI
jgi:hypothetical protein